MSPPATSVRLVVSDVDGTLVDTHKRLTPGVIAAVARLKAAGIGFTIISARPRSGLMPIAEALEIDAPMGAFNGGIVFTRDGTVTRHETIAREVVEGVFALAAGTAVDIWVFADDRWYASTDRGTHAEHERIASAQQPIVRSDFTDLYDRADKITFVSDDAALLAGLADRARPLGERATIVQSQAYYLDVTALAANKGDGVAALADALRVQLAATAVFGDQANDVAMFARAGVSYVMGQAPAAVRAKATHVVAGNDADGVAAAIARVLGE